VELADTRLPAVVERTDSIAGRGFGRDCVAIASGRWTALVADANGSSDRFA
jgi:hypothetical protein